MLSRHRKVITHCLLRGPKWLLPWRLLLQLGFLIRYGAWNRTIVCHFAGYHSVLPAIFGRRCLIILAGNDGASFPNIAYGNHRKRVLGWATRISARLADRLLPVDESLIGSRQYYDPTAPADQGIKAFTTGQLAPHTVVPYGFDAVQWRPDPTVQRDPELVVCIAVGVAKGNATHYRKGLDLLLQAAEQLPGHRFIIVGATDLESYLPLPPNVHILGRTAPEQLRELLSEATCYMQVSMMEGFPNALCEAMLCGCIPIVSNVAAMPGVVDGIGLVVAHRKVDELVAVLRTTSTWTSTDRLQRSQAARSRIVERYGMDRREQTILHVLAEVEA
jgi:glycosyltransferase involved in cell wall biosynthesis